MFLGLYLLFNYIFTFIIIVIYANKYDELLECVENINYMISCIISYIDIICIYSVIIIKFVLIFAIVIIKIVPRAGMVPNNNERRYEIPVSSPFPATLPLPNKYYNLILKDPSIDDLFEAMNILDVNIDKLNNGQYLKESNRLKEIYDNIINKK